MIKKSGIIEDIGTLHSYKCTFTLVLPETINHFDTNSCAPKLDSNYPQKSSCIV